MMSRLIEPNAPSDGPLAPTTPRWQRRHFGVAVVALTAMALGWGAWHYTHQVPAVPSNDVPLPAMGSR